MKKYIKYLIFSVIVINLLIVPVKAKEYNPITINFKENNIIVNKEFKNKHIVDDIKINQLSSICSDKNVKRVVKAFGYVLLISKIIVPIILMVGTIMNYAKAMTANDQKGIKEATSKFAKAGAAALIIFFLPTIINLFLSLAEDDAYDENNYVTCRKCLFDINECK